MSDSETREMQAKCRMKRFVSYRGSRLLRNGSFDGFTIEAAARKQSRRLRATAAPRDDPRRALTLRLETRERVVDQLRIDSLATQVEADGSVPLATFREGPGPPTGETLIVEETDATQLGDGLLELTGVDARASKPLA
jgi:hypothetical protein